MKLPKVYEPNLYESDIYALWERAEAFKPTGKGKPYSIVLPPPNANGNLHLGHGLINAIQDVAIRYHRLKGDRALYLPGSDHAGFETWVVYEKELVKQGKSRLDYSREELYQQIMTFVMANRQQFEGQLRRLGGSFDWSRYTFTLDDKVVRLAYATFKKMWEEKLIYRGERPVNYCTYHQTGFADIEVEYEEANTPLYYIKYGPFTLATTRPETKFGDTAVAVHPTDERYKEYIGRVVTVEGVNGPFEVMVIADEMVDPNFGTGVVKITPAHSFDDWEVAQRHNLPAVRVINHDGTMNEKAGPFRGMTVLEARKAVVKAMQEKGLIEKVDNGYRNRVGKCYKCGTIIEPMLMEQWFVDMQPLAQRAIKALEDDEITFYPEAKKTQLITYLHNLRDWNISRQIAWGIPIPAFRNVDDPDDWVYDDRVEQELVTVTSENGETKTYHRDPEVFDTWFSSSSWPYSTLGYAMPGQQGGEVSDDFKEFYPLSLMETGFDILMPWVSRMIMFGLYVTGEVPFKTVYLHGLVLDEKGQKMSKSKGNVISPIEIIDEYGSDALRIGLLMGQTPGNNQPFTPAKVVGARNFCNKLWNIARYIEDKMGEDYSTKKDGRGAAKPTIAADQWVLQELQHTTENMSQLLEQYRFSEAYDVLYHFVWDDFADWYIEASKAEPNIDMLVYCLEQILKLAHPYAPFVTETIWQTLMASDEPDNMLATAEWPEIAHHDAKQAEVFAEIKKIVSEVRFIKKALNVQGTTLYYTDVPFLTDNAKLIQRLAKLTAVKEVSDGTGLYLTDTKYRCWLDIDESTAKGYATQLNEKRATQEKLVAQLQGRLSNKSYVDNAPRQIVDQTRDQLREAQEQLAAINKEYERFAS